ncbi:hypothetical protein RintRC_7235 [Richelia intracellularis]|nr:hypothetical protein RintRC_7235 [Richelia intracellularis]
MAKPLQYPPKGRWHSLGLASNWPSLAFALENQDIHHNSVQKSVIFTTKLDALTLSIKRASQTIQNQLGKPTATPTLRWVFQCFMSIHLLTFASLKQIFKLSEERCWILQFFGAPCRKYYLLC